MTPKWMKFGSAFLVLALAIGGVLRGASFYYPVTAPIKLYTDTSGRPLNGGYIYFGVANQNPESSPITMYWDAGGTIPAAQPLRTINGYITRQGTPANIFAAGDFSITVRDSARALVFTNPTSTDLQLALSIAGSSSAGAIPIADAGTYYTTDNVEAAFQQLGPLLAQMVTALAAKVPTGARIGYVGATAPAGWVLANNTFIGSSSCGTTGSGEVQLANDTTAFALYVLLWNSYPHSGAGALPIHDNAGNVSSYSVSGASNDFGAGKRLGLPDYRGRVPATLDNLGGGTPAGRLTAAGSAIDGTIMGNSGGAQTHTLSTGEMPSHSHTLTDPGHTHVFAGSAHTHTYVPTNSNNFANVPASGGNPVNSGVGGATNTSSVTAGGTNASSVTGITMATTGGGAAHSVTQPTIVENTIIKL